MRRRRRGSVSEIDAGGGGDFEDGFLVEALAVFAADGVDFGLDVGAGWVEDDEDFAGFVVDVAGGVAPLAGRRRRW